MGNLVTYGLSLTDRDHGETQVSNRPSTGPSGTGTELVTPCGDYETSISTVDGRDENRLSEL